MEPIRKIIAERRVKFLGHSMREPNLDESTLETFEEGLFGEGQ